MLRFIFPNKFSIFCGFFRPENIGKCAWEGKLCENKIGQGILTEVERLCTVDPLIKVACLKKENLFITVKNS